MKETRLFTADATPKLLFFGAMLLAILGFLFLIVLIPHLMEAFNVWLTKVLGV